jgi:hypothetical protein
MSDKKDETEMRKRMTWGDFSVAIRDAAAKMKVGVGVVELGGNDWLWPTPTRQAFLFRKSLGRIWQSSWQQLAVFSIVDSTNIGEVALKAGWKPLMLQHSFEGTAPHQPLR